MIIFSHILGLEYISIVSNCETDYRISWDDKTIIIKDDFFNRFPVENSYLTLAAIPNTIATSSNQFINGNDIPIIFGSSNLYVTEKEITCHIDIFASSYYMLTRWEEYVLDIKDHHNRFPLNASLAAKNNFHSRPIVNEYIEMLWNMMKFLQFHMPRKKRNFQVILTHDIDHLINPVYSLKSFIKDIIRIENPIKIAKQTLKNFYCPISAFYFFMNLSESINSVSRFYFMSLKTCAEDGEYYLESKCFEKIIQLIKKRGHAIGFHPSYNSYNNPTQWELEKINLERYTNVNVNEGRQHYLRYDITITPRIWENNYMAIDSSLYYAEQEGFRCGICNDFQLFDFINRTKLQVIERPLSVMDVSLVKYQSLTPRESYDRIMTIKNTIRKYNGNFVFLWHNTALDQDQWSNYTNTFVDAIRE